MSNKQIKKIISIVVVLAIVVVGCVFVGLQLNNDAVDPVVLNDTETTITNNNSNVTISTNFVEQQSIPLNYREIDANIEQELQSGNYTFEEPLVIVNPYKDTPLTALAVFKTEEECEIRVTAKGHDSINDVTNTLEATADHRVPIFGLYAGEANQVVLEKIVDGKVVETKKIEVQTEQLPEKLDGIVEVYQEPKKSEILPGLTVVCGAGMRTPYAFDNNGDVRWYLAEYETEGHGLYVMSDGKFMIMTQDSMIVSKTRPYTNVFYELDFMGRVYSTYYVPHGVHHEIKEMTPGGDLLVLAGGMEDTNSVEDTIYQIDRETGEVVKEVSMREPYAEFIESVKDDPEWDHLNRYDWSHLNTISYNSEENSIIVSQRNLSTVMKFDWETKKIIWLLCNPEIYKGTILEDKCLTPIGDCDWQYEQHTPYEVTKWDIDNDPDTLDLILFDNRSIIRNKFPAVTEEIEGTNQWSYTVQFSINEKDMTVKQGKRFAGVHAQATSDWELFLDDDIIYTYHGYAIDKNTESALPEGRNGAIYTFRWSNPNKKLAEYRIETTFYRAYRLNFNAQVCTVPMTEHDKANAVEGSNYDYMKGYTQQPSKMETIPSVPRKKVSNDATITLMEDMLYINAFDHAIYSVEFVGKNGAYERKFESVINKGNDYTGMKYNQIVPINELPADTYKVVINYKGVRLNTGGYITIS